MNDDQTPNGDLAATTPTVSQAQPGTIASGYPTGRWAYIDDLTQSLTTAEGGDTNGPQDWVATLFLAAHFNSFPLFMGTTATSGTTGGANTNIDVGRSLSMGVPVYPGSPIYLDYSPSPLSNQIVAVSQLGPFAIASGAPSTDIWAALITPGMIAENLTVYEIGGWNKCQDPIAYNEVQSALGDRFFSFANNEELAMLSTANDFPVDPNDWIDSLRYIGEWSSANTGYVLGSNIKLNESQKYRPTGFRLADSTTVMRMFTGYAPSSESDITAAKTIIPLYENGAQSIWSHN